MNQWNKSALFNMKVWENGLSFSHWKHFHELVEEVNKNLKKLMFPFTIDYQKKKEVSLDNSYKPAI